jgi:SAM-dependent methyltransferase
LRSALNRLASRLSSRTRQVDPLESTTPAPRLDLLEPAIPDASMPADEFFASTLVDLGKEAPRYAGVLTPESEVGLSKTGVTDTLLSGAEDYFNKYQSFSYWLVLLEREISALGREPAGVAVDFGSGFGNTVIPLLERFPDLRVLATDISPDLLSILRREAIRRGLMERCAAIAFDAQRDYLRSEFADWVFGSAVLHHLVDPEALVRSALKVLKPGGHATFFEPFEEGHAVLRLAFSEILEEVKRRRAKGPAFDFLAVLVKDIAVRTHRRGYPGFETLWLEIDDKWLFTRSFFDQIRLSVGASDLQIRPLHGTETPFTTQTENVLKHYAGLPSRDALPDWAWEILRRYDQDAFSDEMKGQLTLEAAVVITK